VKDARIRARRCKLASKLGKSSSKWEHYNKTDVKQSTNNNNNNNNATECKFTFTASFYRQTDGSTMGGPLSVTLSDIYMVKLENDIVVPLKPKFYRRYVDDIYNRRKKNTEDILFKELNSYHPNINLTVEINPTKFLDTKLICVNGVYKTMVNRKETKLPIHWSSKIPKRYKRNSVLGDLHRAKRISSDFQTEVIQLNNLNYE